MIKIIGTTQEIDDFLEALVCPVEDNVKTIKEDLLSL
jgi:hypothetical protein